MERDKRDKKGALLLTAMLGLGALGVGYQVNNARAGVAGGRMGDTLPTTTPASTDVKKLCGPGVVARGVDPERCNEGVSPVTGREVK